MKELEEMRGKIDELDKELVEIFEARLELVLKVLSYKKEKNLPIYQPKREEEILEKIQSYTRTTTFEEEVTDLFKAVFKISKNLQAKNVE